ncbi:MAG: ATP synthase F1 subunit gamma [Bacteroidetes bacterium]|nr:ATP synthase F1 subunit gamma [Rhodothermaceae bacterium RA]RMH62789.1 MAG: ATP synthase F1 subunit gamma [Bacteroidota bacterium]
MASLRDIRNRITSVRNTQQVTRAMKMVAAAKLRKAQERIFRTRPYAFKIGEIISHLKGQVDPATHPLFMPRPEATGVLLIIVTADRGLAGAFNTNIIKLAETAIQEQYAGAHERGDLYLICVGRKGHDHFRKRGYQLVGDFRGVFNDLSFDTVQAVMKLAIDGYLEDRWGEVAVVYNEFRNTIAQNRIVEPLLPIRAEQFLTPVMRQEIEHQAEVKPGQEVDYIFEPDAATILEALVPRYLNYQLWRVLLESNAAEQGARMVAMDNATSNAEELLRTLKLQYNRARQDAITTELIEIVSGANALEAG